MMWCRRLGLRKKGEHLFRHGDVKKMSEEKAEHIVRGDFVLVKIKGNFKNLFKG